MKQDIHSAAPALVILSFSAASTFGLHQLGDVPWLSVEWSNLSQWLDGTPPTEALISAFRLVGLGCGWWILVSTCFYLLARLRRATAAMRMATLITPPFIRSLSARVAVGAVTVTTLGSTLPAVASTDHPPMTGQFDSHPVPLGVSHPPPVVTHQAPEPRRFRFPLPWLNPVETADQPIEAPDIAEGRIPFPIPYHPSRIAPADSYRIVAGDNLWSIARRVLSQAMDHHPTTEQITSYWVDLIEANRENISSEDPDLIYPGERILLPDIRKV